MFRFTVRELALAIAVVSVCLGWWVTTKENVKLLAENAHLRLIKKEAVEWKRSATDQKARADYVADRLYDKLRLHQPCPMCGTLVQFPPLEGNPWKPPANSIWNRESLIPDPPGFVEEVKAAGLVEGEWEIVEMVFRGKVQDFCRKPGGWIWFKSGEFALAYSTKEFPTTYPCTIRPREIDIHPNGFTRDETVLKALYDLQGDNLQLAWRDDGDRPTSFEAQKDLGQTLYRLKKVK